MSDPARLTDQQIDPDECPACEACEHSLVKAERRLEAAEAAWEAELATSEKLREAHKRMARIVGPTRPGEGLDALQTQTLWNILREALDG